jgi:cell division protein FtsB
MGALRETFVVTHLVTSGSDDVVRHSPQHRRSPWVALFLLLALGLTLAGIFPFRQMLAQQRQVANTEAKLEAVAEENRQLESQIASLQTNVGVERLAREQLGLVRPGETGYQVESVEGPVPETPGNVTEQVFDERSMLQQFWDFLTGRDLVPDE